ncbi:MAG: UDP-N-acetylmuramate--alanine ligase [Actinomycetota bacterium]|nr:UDP-N-acetylmuramate--alanine ligase [Actinomycetota bacterium]
MTGAQAAGPPGAAGSSGPASGSATGAGAIDLRQPRRIHVVGVGGSGMSAIAEVLAGMGHQVSGSDLRPSPALDRLAGLGVRVFVGHAEANLGMPGERLDAVAISTAVPPDNPEVAAARRRSVPVLARSAVLAAICAERRTMAVSGTHGKTTTSSLLALGLVGAGLRPSFVVGGEIIGLGSGARWDDGDWLVVEADESDGTFLELPSDTAIVTSLEADHLEHYGSLAALEEAFDRFLANASGTRLVCADDPGAAAVGRRHEALSYGTSSRADMRMVEVVGGRSSVRFGLLDHGRRLGEVEVPLPGLHNARNAAGAVSAALLTGASFAAVVAAVAGSAGVGRRFQVRGERRGVTFVDDYAHLPGEVAATLAAARDGRWERIVCVFQPHRYSRTAALWRDFGSSFEGADVLLVTDVYAAGEPPRPGVSGRLIVDAVVDRDADASVTYLPTRPELVAHLRQVLRPGDLCLTLGAGDLTTLADELLAE